jgi:hypothetical protein
MYCQRPKGAQSISTMNAVLSRKLSHASSTFLSFTVILQGTLNNSRHEVPTAFHAVVLKDISLAKEDFLRDTSADRKANFLLRTYLLSTCKSHSSSVTTNLTHTPPAPLRPSFRVFYVCASLHKVRVSAINGNKES